MSELFVLISLIPWCLQSFFALLFGMDRPSTPAQRASVATTAVDFTQLHPLAYFPAPTLRLMV